MSEQLPNAFNQVDQQLANGMPAAVLVERSNGDITTGQVLEMTDGRSIAHFGDISNGVDGQTPARLVPNEKLTDAYQEHLAERLAGKALRGSGVEIDTDSIAVESTTTEQTPSSPVDKYTAEYIKDNKYAHLFDPELSEDQIAQVNDRIQSIDTRTDDQKRAAAEQAAIEAMSKQRTIADSRYNLARQSGADHDAAQLSADKAYMKTHQELLTEELKKLGLEG